MVTPVFDRRMFQRPLPGYNPRGGGITDVTPPAFTQSVASSEVAARPLLVSDRAPVVFGNQTGRFAGVTNEQLLNEYTTLEASIQQAEDTRLRSAGPVPDLSAQKAELNVIGQELNNRNVSVEPKVEEVAAVPVKPVAAEAEVVDSSAVAPILKAAEDSTEAAVASGQVTPEEAIAKATQANAALEGVQEAEDSLEAQFEAVGVGDEFSVDNYKQKAKEILGVDASADDVPEWAAPIFLFGLNLMKAPVSSQTGQQGLGGLLADIGAAGEVGFKQFAVERARRQAKREKIGSLALSMMNQDKQTRIAMATAEVEKTRWWANFQQKEGENKVANFNKTFDRYTAKIDDPEDLATFSAEFNALAAIAQASGRLGDPVVTNLIGALATERAGISTPFQMETVNFGYGKELNYSKSGLKRLAKQERMSEGELLSAIIANPTDPKYAGVAVAVNITKNQFEDKSRTENGVTIPAYEDIALRDAELAKAKAENRPPNPEAYRVEQTAYIEGKPNFELIQLGNVGGEKRSAYMDLAQFGLVNQRRRKAGKPELTFSQVLRQPTKYPKIISQTMLDTSGALDNISLETIFTGEDTKQKFIFNRNLLDQNRTQIAEELGIPADQVDMSVIGKDLDLMEQLGILIPSGDQWKETTPITISRLDRDGKGLVTMTGSAGDVEGLESKAERAKLMHRLESTETLNRMSFRVFSIYDQMYREDRSKAQNVTSAFTGLRQGIVAAGRLAGLGNLGVSADVDAAMARIRDFDIRDDDGQATVLIDEFSTAFDDWAGSAIKDAKERQKLKTLFIDMAFQLASAREAGKLTDNDVKYAFQTLGFNNDAFFDTPEIVIAGLQEAVMQSNDKMEAALNPHLDDETREMLRVARGELPDNPEKQVFVLEHYLRQRNQDLQPSEDNWGHEGENQFYRVDNFIRHNPDYFKFISAKPTAGREPGAATGAPDPISIQYMGETITLNRALSRSATTVVDILDTLKIPRTQEGFGQWYNGLTEEQRKLFGPAITEINEADFWGTQ